MLSHLLFSEATRFQKETGKKLPRWQQKLLAYEKLNSREGNLFVHFSNYPRMGLYLVNEHDTPIGFYSYQIDRNTISNFATSRPFVIIFRPKPTARILNLSSYSEEEFNVDLGKLQKFNSASLPTGHYFPGKGIWELTKKLSGFTKAKYSQVMRGGGPTGRWTYLLWKVLGYDGVVDNGQGIIYQSQKQQAVWFNTTQLEILDILQKPEEEEEGDDLANPFKTKNVSGEDYSNSTLQGENWNGFTAANTNFANSTLAQMNMRSCNLQFANFQGAELKDCDFTWAKLIKVDFQNSILNKCNFSGTNLKDADLSTAEGLESCSLAGAVYSTKTRFPVGFDPEQKYMSLVG